MFRRTSQNAVLLQRSVRHSSGFFNASAGDSAKPAAAAAASTTAPPSSGTPRPSSSAGGGGVPLAALYHLLARQESSSSSSVAASSCSGAAAPSPSSSSAPLSIVDVSNRTANDVLFLIANDLRDDHHHHHHNQQQQQQPSSSNNNMNNASRRVPPIMVYKLVLKICEECRLQQAEEKKTMQQHQSTDAVVVSRFSIQKNTLMTLLLGLARLAESSGGAQQQQQSEAAEGAIAALCEMSLPHIPHISPPEWIGVVASFAKMKLLTSSGGGGAGRGRLQQQKEEETRETQRACAFMVHLALEGLLFSGSAASAATSGESNSNDAGAMMVLSRVRDALNFSINLSKLLPRAIQVLPIPEEQQNDIFVLEPTWQQAVAKLVERLAVVMEICTTDQACLMLQNGCLLVTAFCSPSSSSVTTTLRPELVAAFSTLIERATERIAATLSTVYKDSHSSNNNNTSTSPVDALFASEIDMNVVASVAPQITATVYNLFGTVTSALRVVRDLEMKKKETVSADGGMDELFSNAAQLLKLCTFTARIGPQLLHSSLEAQKRQQQQQQQQQQDDSSSSNSIGATFSNVLGQVMHIENSHVALRRVLDALPSEAAALRQTLASTGALAQVAQSHADYVAACGGGGHDILLHFQAHTVSQISSLLHVLQCVSNRLQQESRDFLVAEAAKAKELREQRQKQDDENEEASALKNGEGEDDEDEEVVVDMGVAELEVEDSSNSNSSPEAAESSSASKSTTTATATTASSNNTKKLVGGVLLTEEHRRTLIPIALQALSEIERRAVTDPSARMQLFNAARSNFGTVRRLVPLFSAGAVLEPMMALTTESTTTTPTSEDGWQSNRVLAGLYARALSDVTAAATATASDEPTATATATNDPTLARRVKLHALAVAFKGLLRLVKDGLSQRPRPKIGLVVAFANFAAEEAPRTFKLLAGDDDFSLQLRVRDAMLLDVSAALLERCSAGAGTALPLDQKLGCVAAVARMHRCVTQLQKEVALGQRKRREAEAEEEAAAAAATAAEEQGEDEIAVESNKSNGTTTPAAAAEDNTNNNDAAKKRLAQRQLDEQIQMQQLSTASKHLVAAAEALCDDTRGALRLQIRDALEKQKQQQQEQQQQQQDLFSTRMLLSLVQRLAPLSESISSPVHQLLSFLLLTVLPSRLETLSPLEATLALSAMQAAKLWRQSVVVALMRIVKNAHEEVGGESSSSSSSDSASSSKKSPEQQQRAAKELSSALVALCQFTNDGGSSSGGGGGGAAAAATTATTEEESSGAMVANLVQSLTHIDKAHVPVQSIISVWRKLVQSSVFLSSTSSSTAATADPFESTNALVSAILPRVAEMAPTSRADGLSSDVTTCLAALDRTLRRALDPSSGGRKARAAVVQNLAQLLDKIFEEHVVEGVSSSSSSSSSSSTTCSLQLNLSADSITGFDDLSLVCRIVRQLHNVRALGSVVSRCSSAFFGAVALECWSLRVRPRLQAVFGSSADDSESSSSSSLATRISSRVSALQSMDGAFFDVFFLSVQLGAVDGDDEHKKLIAGAVKTLVAAIPSPLKVEDNNSTNNSSSNEVVEAKTLRLYTEFLTQLVRLEAIVEDDGSSAAVTALVKERVLIEEVAAAEESATSSAVKPRTRTGTGIESLCIEYLHSRSKELSVTISSSSNSDDDAVFLRRLLSFCANGIPPPTAVAGSTLLAALPTVKRLQSNQVGTVPRRVQAAVEALVEILPAEKKKNDDSNNNNNALLLELAVHVVQYSRRALMMMRQGGGGVGGGASQAELQQETAQQAALRANFKKLPQWVFEEVDKKVQLA